MFHHDSTTFLDALPLSIITFWLVRKPETGVSHITSGLPRYSSVWKLAAASNHNFGAIGDGDPGHASADPASPASYNRNFFPEWQLNSAWRLRYARLPTCLSAS